MTSSGLYRQSPLPFWRGMAGCIAIARSPPPWIGSFLSPYTNQSRAVITMRLKKASVEEEKRVFPILKSIYRRSTIEISKGNPVLLWEFSYLKDSLVCK